MKERPILMSAPMVKAILDGRKTQTRRVVKGAWHEPGGYLQSEPEGDEDGEWWFSCSKVPASFSTECPYGKIGDGLWVKETFAPLPGAAQGANNGVIYRATETSTDEWLWKPSIFMPRWASRITLEIEQVRVERLQDISEEDAKCEGVAGVFYHSKGGTDGAYRKDFWRLWDSINGKSHPWSSNPWVWKIVFRKV